MIALLADTATFKSSNVRLVAAANEKPEPDEEFLSPFSSGTPSSAERVAAENFNPNHDELGKFTSAGGAVSSGAQKSTHDTPWNRQAGKPAPGDSGPQQSGSGGGGAGGGDDGDDDEDHKGPQKRDPGQKGGSYGGTKSAGKQGGATAGKGGTQQPVSGISQPNPPKFTLPVAGKRAAGGQKSPLGVPVDGPLKGGNPGDTTPPEGPFQKLSKSTPYDGKLSSNPCKEDHISGSRSPALAREAVAQISKMTGKEVLLPVSRLAEDIQGSHSGSATGFSGARSNGAAAVHDLVPILRKHQIACEDLSGTTKNGRSGIEQIAAHLHHGPVLVAVSSGSNAHGELIMGQSKNGLYRVYNPSKGGEDMLHASQIDPRGVIALSPSL